MNLPQRNACFTFTIVNPSLIFERRVKNWEEQRRRRSESDIRLKRGGAFFSPAGFFPAPRRERKFTRRSRSALNSKLHVLNVYLKIVQRKRLHESVSVRRRGHICLQHGCARVWRYFATREDGQLNMTEARHEVEYDVLMKQHGKWGKFLGVLCAVKMRWVCSCALLLMVLMDHAGTLPAWRKHTVTTSLPYLVQVHLLGYFICHLIDVQ